MRANLFFTAVIILLCNAFMQVAEAGEVVAQPPPKLGTKLDTVRSHLAGSSRIKIRQTKLGRQVRLDFDSLLLEGVVGDGDMIFDSSDRLVALIWSGCYDSAYAPSPAKRIHWVELLRDVLIGRVGRGPDKDSSDKYHVTRVSWGSLDDTYSDYDVEREGCLAEFSELNGKYLKARRDAGDPAY